MAKEYAKSFYNSKAWKRVRKAYFNSQYGLCEICLKNGEHTPGDIVHHIKHITPENINDPEITLNFNNLQLLCHDHHNKIHSTSEVTKEGYRFNVKGKLVKDE
jgi:5-methylcytosine-specific restriction endonuclease McrA